jgi:hypothetical protein
LNKGLSESFTNILFVAVNLSTAGKCKATDLASSENLKKNSCCEGSFQASNRMCLRSYYMILSDTNN